MQEEGGQRAVWWASCWLMGLAGSSGGASLSLRGFLRYMGAGLAQLGLGEPLALPHGSSEDSAECLVWTWWAQSPGDPTTSILCRYNGRIQAFQSSDANSGP